MTLPRQVALGTMHGKAAAIAPPLAGLGIDVVVPDGLDTDRFGTFTGEVPRPGTMIEAARAKARAAIAASGLSVGMASEGAYGPHPYFPFLAQGRELLLWLDAQSGHEIVETLADDAPCYDRVEVRSFDEATGFLTRIGFPETGVIVAPAADRTRLVAKGIRNHDQLARAIHAANGPAIVQTDMRAHLNPRRMDTIGRLAARFAGRLACACGRCGAPGWGFLRLGPNLPCAGCGSESILPASEIHGCSACGSEQRVPRPDGRTEADPGSCPHCNP